MKTFKKILFWTCNFLFFFIAGMEFCTLPVHAYIDPSAVTYIIQAVAGVVIAIGACLTIFRHKIAAFFKKNKTEEKKEVHFKEDAEEVKEAVEEAVEKAADVKEAIEDIKESK